MAPTGKELTVPHQMSLAGAVSLPVFWLAGAGAAVFWVLGKNKHFRQQYCCFFKHHCWWQSVLKTDLRQEGEGNFAAFNSRCPSHSFIYHQSWGHSWTTVTLMLWCCLAGATLFVIGSHAAFRELEASDVEELLMEPVWRASFLRCHQLPWQSRLQTCPCVRFFFFLVCHLGQCTRSSLICL